MEDLHRPLPSGWIRQFDTQENHQFYVDTNCDPPRSIWSHPYDDPTYLSTLPPDESRKHTRVQRSVTLEDVTAESSDDEADPRHAKLPPRTKPIAGSSSQPTGFHKFTRKMKDKITDSTHEQREQQRQHRAEAEQRAYQMHLRAREAMQRALQTGEPQFLCKDEQGRDVYIEPPNRPGGARGFGGYGGGYGYSPYQQGLYGNPNARFVRPSMPYSRPYGYGYGGGIGMPVAGGLLGGMMLGSMMF